VPVFRRLASALALYGIPLALVLATVSWFGLRIVRGVDPPIVTTTSTAMKPAVRPGDLVFLSDVDEGSLDVGDVIAFRDDAGDVTMRRIVEVLDDGEYEVLGDNRRDDEPFVTTDDRVIGRVGSRLPLFGYWLVFLRSLAGQVLLAAVCFFGFAGAFRARFFARHEDEPDEVPPEPEAVTYGGGPMSITPAELRHVRFAQVRRGYDTEAVDRALESVADSIEELLHERHELVERIRQLESEIERYREVEATLTQTLSLAERAADELKAEAQAEAERMMNEARAQMAQAQQLQAKAAEATAAAQAQVAAAAAAPAGGQSSALPDPAFIELLGETRAIRSLLQAMLTTTPEGGSPFTPRQP